MQFIHSAVDGRLDCFHILGIVNSGALSVHGQVFVSTPALVCLGTGLEVEFGAIW